MGLNISIWIRHTEENYGYHEESLKNNLKATTVCMLRNSINNEKLGSTDMLKDNTT